MKRILSLIGCAAVTLAAMADPITPAKALLLAQKFISQGETPTIQLAAKRSGKFEFSPAKGTTTTNSDTTNTAPYYIISRGAGQGFVIVSGDDCLPQVLAVIDSGDFDEDNMPDEFRDWLQYRADKVEYLQSKGINTPFVSTAVVEGRVDVPYLVQTLWHQSSPYNDKCPKITSNGNRAVTGCVATATSQVAYYWRNYANPDTQYDTPTYGYGDAPATSDYQIKGGTYLDWKAMANVSTGAGQTAVATLNATVGMSGWLTYGSSTSGQIGNMPNVLSGQLGLHGGTCVYKNSGYTESAWSQLLYNQLIQGRPLIYCGQNASQGGHAVVCDGYQASTGFFHINFGWGANYNGYFSVEDGSDSGWGFNDAGGQGCVYDIYGIPARLDINVKTPEHIYSSIPTTYTISVTNDTTVSYTRDIYMFIGTNTAPTSFTTTTPCYKDHIGAKKTISFDTTLKYNLAGNKYIYITDGNLNILKKIDINVEKPGKNITFKKLSIASSADTEELDGNEYKVIYNNSSTITAQLENKTDVPFYGGLLVKVFGYNTDTKAWESVGTSSLSPFPVINEKEEASVTFNITNSSKLPITTGKYYYAVLSDSIVASTNKVQNVDSKDNIVRFILKGSDMQVVSFTNNILALSGHFDPTLFNSTTFAKKSTYSSAVGYDLTQCTDIEKLSQDVNPNAIYYVNSESKANGINIAKDGHIAHMVLTPGYNFGVKEGVIADSSEIKAVEIPGQWYFITTPVKVDVPLGMAAREITGHPATISSNFLSKLTDVTTLEAGKTYLLTTSYSKNNTLRVGASAIAATPATNTDAKMIGTYLNTTTPAGGMIPNDSTVQCLKPVATGTAVEALRGYMCDTNLKNPIKLNKSMVYDPKYLALAQDINTAYQTLEDSFEVKSQAANDTLLSQIKKAEYVFTYRSDYTTTNPAKATYENLEAAIETYKTSVKPLSVTGDVNEDGKVDFEDIRAVIDVIIGGTYNAKADVNDDKAIDVRDVNKVIATICNK